MMITKKYERRERTAYAGWNTAVFRLLAAQKLFFRNLPKHSLLTVTRNKKKKKKRIMSFLRTQSIKGWSSMSTCRFRSRGQMRTY